MKNKEEVGIKRDRIEGGKIMNKKPHKMMD